MLTLRQTWSRMLIIWQNRCQSRRMKKGKLTRASATTKIHATSTKVKSSHATVSRAKLASKRSSAALSVELNRPSAPRMSLRLPMTFTSHTDLAEGLVAQLITRSSTHSVCKKSIWRGCIKVTQSSWLCLSSLSAHTPLTQRLELSMRTRKKSITVVLKCMLKLRNAVRKC